MLYFAQSYPRIASPFESTFIYRSKQKHQVLRRGDPTYSPVPVFMFGDNAIETTGNRVIPGCNVGWVLDAEKPYLSHCDPLVSGPGSISPFIGVYLT